MMGIRLFSRATALSLVFAGGALATPPQIITGAEKFFGDGGESYAVLRTVTDNKGSYYRFQTTTSLVEKSKATGEKLKEILLLDREEITDAEYDGPGKAPVKVVIHAKDEKETLGGLLERWPRQGRWMEAAELKRFKVHESGIRFDGRLEVMEGNSSITNLKEGGFRFSDWGIADGLEGKDTIFFKAIRADGEGETDESWLCVNPEATAQIRAFRNIQPVYLSLGSSGDREEAVKLARKAATDLKAGKFPTQGVEIWKREGGNGSPEYQVVVEGSDYVIKNGKVEELEKLLGTPTPPIASDRFQEWIPLPVE